MRTGPAAVSTNDCNETHRSPARITAHSPQFTARARRNFLSLRWNCQYEWRAHEKLAREAGLKSSIIDGISRGAVPEGMSAEEAAIHRFCKEVHATGRAEDEAFKAVKERFGLDGALELIALNGY